ncbi:unnamed protein product [Gulo gulo]|uniref:Mitochondrial intermembrane space import and assembly protein 40 n=1 Tax=Gulo gulo TaxID=48420 RepID=A0A9X9LYJ1_GULGU|nr:unnamed protein product [Gulo gulo]
MLDDPKNPDEHGLILPDGDINWNWPWEGPLWGMASGPCGKQFKWAFFCLQYSTEDSKPSDCVDQFWAMQECMQKHHYPCPQKEEEEEMPAELLEQTAPTEAPATKEEQVSS